MTDNIGPRLKVASVFIFIGFIMTLGMATTIFLNPGGGNLYEVRAQWSFIADLDAATSSDINIKLASLIFDNFFMIGYLCIFYGLFLITREKEDFIAKIAFALGGLTFFSDLVENAFQILILTGVPNDFWPSSSFVSTFWTIMYIKDISSYMAGFTFIVLLLVSLSEPVAFRTAKVVFVILLGLYVGLGVIAIIEPTFLVFRNLSFMVDLLVASLLFHRLSTLMV